MPTRLKNLKVKAQMISKALGHDMIQFERCEETAWASFCKGCGRQMMVDPESEAGFWGTATEQDCGPVQPEVPLCCLDARPLGLAEQLEIIELKCEPQEDVIVLSVDEASSSGKTVMVSTGSDSDMKLKEHVMKPTGKFKEFPDGTVYEMRSDGWRRRDDLRRRSS